MKSIILLYFISFFVPGFLLASDIISVTTTSGLVHATKTKNIIVSGNLLDLKEDNIILILKGGSSTFESIKDIVKRVDLLSLNVIGWIF